MLLKDQEKKMYSDGEIEDTLISTLSKNGDVFSISYNGGAIFHNFTDARENLINWYPFTERSSALEIGAGMGSLTGILCDRCENVVALEQSAKRVEIIKQRHKNRNNLEIVCSDVFDYESSQKFDYILLIGVLEYAGVNSEDVNPYEKMLDKIGSLLKPDGTLLLAIENQYGLKYWCGAAEDHTGVPFDGISGYLRDGYTTRYDCAGVRTFSREHLKRILSDSGLSNQRWYYPLPDYKFPMAVFSEEQLPQNKDIDAIKFSFPMESELIADEKKLYKEIIDNNVFPFFANSFFIEAKKSELTDDFVKCVYFKRDYKNFYGIATLINSKKEVIKKCMHEESIPHLKRLANNMGELTARGIFILEGEIRDGEIVQKWKDLPRVSEVFSRHLIKGQWESATNLIDELEKNIRKSSDIYLAKNCTLAGIEKLDFDEKQEILLDGYVDMTFVNSFYDGDKILFFDQEWKYQDVPIKYILYRAIKYAYKEDSAFSIEKLYHYIGLDDRMKKQFQVVESRLLQSMMDEEKCAVFDPNMYHEGLTLQYKWEQIKGVCEREKSEKENLNNRNLDLENEVLDLGNRNLDLENKILDLENQNFNLEKENLSLEGKNLDLETKNLDLENKNLDLTNKDVDSSQKITQLLEVQRQYDAIINSISWRMVNRMCKMYDKVFHKDGVHTDKSYFIGKYIEAFNLVNIKFVCDAFKMGGLKQVQKEMRAFRQRISIGVLPEKPQLFIEENIDDIKQYEKLIFKKSDNPQVSIIIPVFNQFTYTYNCLKAILENSGDVAYEIIVADDVSYDLTTCLADVAENINIIRNETNQMFLRNCNNAAKYATGKYILFLNNDTQVQKNWLAPLVDLIESDDAIGMVGSKLIYPDGTLQEAGGIVWGDGHAWNYGNGQNSANPEFNYVKEVDYISGAAIMIRTNLWNEIGGFDDRFAPAYYEDTDLAFEIRKRGYKLMYQPLSVVVHFEGKSNGTDISAGIKSYQVENAAKFINKWKEELKHQSQAEDDLFHAKDRSQNKKAILVVDHYVPQHDKDAGGKCTYMYLKMFVKMGLKVVFIGDNFYKSEPYTTELNQIGIEVLYGNYYYNNWQSWLEDNGRYFDYIYLQRPHISIKYIDIVKKYSDAKIFYFAHDLHHLRERRQYELTGDKKSLESSEKWKKIEYELFGKADVGHVVGSYEQKLMQQAFPGIPIRNIPLYIYEEVPSDINKDFPLRNDIMYVGGFGHPPNIDAVLWFGKEIFPLIVKELPGIKWHIVGSNPPKEVRDLGNNHNIIVHGFVSDEQLDIMYRECRMAVVPLRVGAGVKGKVVEAAYYQIPLITTPVGAEGISLIEGAFEVAECDESMAQKIVGLYSDFNKLQEMSDKSVLLIKNHYTVDAARKVLEMDMG